jgi:hypothetical protein
MISKVVSLLEQNIWIVYVLYDIVQITLTLQEIWYSKRHHRWESSYTLFLFIFCINSYAFFLLYKLAFSLKVHISFNQFEKETFAFSFLQKKNLLFIIIRKC